MKELATICESMKRHIVAILVVTVLVVAAGFAWGATRSSDPSTDYAAEATIYVTVYAEDTIGDYNFSYSDDKTIADSRRLIVSSEVAGKVREQYGDEVTISSPQWKEEGKTDFTYSRVICVDATAPTEQTALDAANAAAELAADLIEDTIPNSTVSTVTSAELRVQGEEAVDYGTAALSGSDEYTAATQETASGVSTKMIFILAVLGFFGSACVFVLWDVLTRKVRSVRDIDRIFGIPVLATLGDKASASRAADATRVLMNNADLHTLAVVGASSASDADQVAKLFEQAGVTVNACVGVAGDTAACTKLAACDAAVVVVKESADSAKQNAALVDALCTAGTTVVGAVFIPRKADLSA